MSTLKTTLGVIGTALVVVSLLAACAPLSTLNALVPTHTHSVTQGVAYGALPRHRLDIYRPTAAAPQGGWPVVVFFYGGSWNSGERADYKFVGEALASRGVLTLVADYRLYPEVRFPDFLHDSAEALAYGLRQASALGGNPRRVFAMGHSAGAYNAAMLALDAPRLERVGHSPAELAGWIGLAGPYDFLPIGNPDVKPVFHHPHYPPGSQPVQHVRAGAPRSFLGAAVNDTLVDPQRNTVGLARRLEAQGVPVTLKLYDGLNHVTIAGALGSPLRWMAPVLDDVATFIHATPH
jgi:acetyl esterase/lipase